MAEDLVQNVAENIETSNNNRFQANCEHSFVIQNLCMYAFRPNRGYIGMEPAGGTTWIPIKQTYRGTFADPT